MFPHLDQNRRYCMYLFGPPEAKEIASEGQRPSRRRKEATTTEGQNNAHNLDILSSSKSVSLGASKPSPRRRLLKKPVMKPDAARGVRFLTTCVVGRSNLQTYTNFAVCIHRPVRRKTMWRASSGCLLLENPPFATGAFKSSAFVGVAVDMYVDVYLYLSQHLHVCRLAFIDT